MYLILYCFLIANEYHARINFFTVFQYCVVFLNFQLYKEIIIILIFSELANVEFSLIVY